MEALGVVASFIAIGQVLGALPAISSSIRSLKNIKEDLALLLNELSRLQATQIQISDLTKLFYMNHKSLNLQEPGAFPSSGALKDIQDDLESVVAQLRDLAKNCQRSEAKKNPSGVRITKWVWNKAKIQGLRDQAKDVRFQLQLELTRLSAWNQSFQTKIILEFKEASIACLDQHTTDLQEIKRAMGSLVVTQAAQQGQPRVIEPQDSHEDDTNAELDMGSASSELVNVVPANSDRSSYIRNNNTRSASPTDEVVSFTTSYRVQCGNLCRCQCHHRRRSKSSPSWLNTMIGSFFLSYDVSPIFDSQKCNLTSCRNSKSSVQFTYFLPKWACLRGISLSFHRNSAFGRGASMAFEFPAILPYKHILTRKWRFPDVQSLYAVLDRDGIRINDREEGGMSVLTTAVIGDTSLPFVPALLQYYGISSIDQIASFDMSALHKAANILTYWPESSKAIITQTPLVSVGSVLSNSSIIDCIMNGGNGADLTQAIKDEPWAIDSWGMDGIPPLIVACEEGNNEAIQILIKFGADVNAAGHTPTSSPIAAACYPGNLKGVELLLDAGFDPNCSASTYFLLGHCCKSLSAESLDILALLVQRGSDVSACSPSSHQNLIFALIDQPGMEDKLNFLTSHGININDQNRSGECPLFCMVMSDMPMVVEALLRRRANTALRDIDGWGLLHFISFFATLPVIRLFLESGRSLEWIDYDCQDVEGVTALDLFKIRICRINGYRRTHPRATTEEVTALSELFSMVRDNQLQENMAVVAGVVKKLKENKSGRVESQESILTPLEDRKRKSGNTEEAETLRVVQVQLRENMWEAAIEALEELLERWEESMRMPPLQDWSPFLTPVVKTWVGGDGFVRGEIKRKTPSYNNWVAQYCNVGDDQDSENGDEEGSSEGWHDAQE